MVSKSEILRRVQAYHAQPRYTPPSRAPNSGTQNFKPSTSNKAPTTVKTSKSTYNPSNKFGTGNKVVTVTPKETPQYTITDPATGKTHTATTEAEAKRKHAEQVTHDKKAILDDIRNEADKLGYVIPDTYDNKLNFDLGDAMEFRQTQKQIGQKNRDNVLWNIKQNYDRVKNEEDRSDYTRSIFGDTHPNDFDFSSYSYNDLVHIAETQNIRHDTIKALRKEEKRLEKERKRKEKEAKQKAQQLAEQKVVDTQNNNAELVKILRTVNPEPVQTQTTPKETTPPIAKLLETKPKETTPPIAKLSDESLNSLQQNVMRQYDRDSLNEYKFLEKVKKNPTDYSSHYDYGIVKDYNPVADTASSFLLPFTSIGLTGKNLIDSTLFGGKDQYHIHESGIGKIIEGGITDTINLPDIIMGKKKPTTPTKFAEAQQYYAKFPNRLLGELGGEVALGIMTMGVGTVLKPALKSLNPITKSVLRVGDQTVSIVYKKKTNEVLATIKGAKISKGLDLDLLNPEKMLSKYKGGRGQGEINVGDKAQEILTRDKTIERLLKEGTIGKTEAERLKAGRQVAESIMDEAPLKQVDTKVQLKGTTPDQSKAMFTGLSKAQKKYGIGDIHGSVVTKSVVDTDTLTKTGIKLEPGDLDMPVKLSAKDRILGRSTSKKDKAITEVGEQLRSQLKPDESIAYEGLGKKGTSNRSLYLIKGDGTKVKKAEVIDKGDQYAKGLGETDFIYGKKIDYGTQTYKQYDEAIKGIKSPAQTAENLKQATSIQKVGNKIKIEPDPGRAKDVRRTYLLAKEKGKTSKQADIAAERFKSAYKEFFDKPPKKGTGKKGTAKTNDEIITRSVVRSSIRKPITRIGKQVAKQTASNIASRAVSSRLRPSKIPSRVLSRIPGITPSSIPGISPSQIPGITPSSIPGGIGGTGYGTGYGTGTGNGNNNYGIGGTGSTGNTGGNNGGYDIVTGNTGGNNGGYGFGTGTGTTTRTTTKITTTKSKQKRIGTPIVKPLFPEGESSTKRRSSKKNKQFVGNTFRDYAFGFTGDQEVRYSTKAKELKQKSIRQVKRKKKRRRK